MSEEETKPSEAAPKKKEVDHIIIRPWPKMVFLYPSLILSIVFGIFSAVEPSLTGPGVDMAVYWLLAFGVNIFVMAFEFNRLRSTAIFSMIIALVAILLYAGKEADLSILSSISGAVMSIQPLANSRFYFAMAGIMVVLFVFMFLHTRFDYWEVTHNELRHHHGILGNVERFPAPHLRFTKEINDVVEFLMLLSGTLVLFPASESRTLVLHNVPRINRIERNLEHLLSKLAVDIEPG
ncbi:MAG: hypothetical protein ACYS47_14635 [Planctomycetota bacterium]|jgi:hypothetical protein